ncbi:MAG: hypothetical protein AVDCRST_MAG01-01-1108 [uncultured Rubrobacteraceae bacterium]|uniref:DUF7452 domain-containing protein n=1 Tax=uncultured Rubrobacteraceae bacterium TaxID=349277 RepID=A0A6J4P7F1_9ACTN|nr:MAG: hypothetical protein AVDCRST_MAG01-01-1108 [uncultured Rubrobacteraceae bacterium]
MRLWLRGRSLPVRVLLYAALAALAFVLAAGVGAVGALALRGDLAVLLKGSQARPTDDQGAARSGAAGDPADPKTDAEGTASGAASGAAQGTEGADAGEKAGEETAFVHAATGANSRGDYTYLDHPRINGDPDAVVLAQPSPGRGGQAGAAYGHNVGVWYEPTKERWAIFNQDLAAVPAGSAFEVVVPPAGLGFVHRTALPNTVGNATYLDNLLTNGEPGTEVSVTQNWNPGGGNGVYNDHPVGVLYDEDVERWLVYNEDDSRMPEGAAFNVAVSGAAEPAR